MSRQDLQAIAVTLDKHLNGSEGERQFGFAVFVFEFGKTEGGRINYISNAARPEMIVAVKEWLARVEGRYVEGGGHG